jgi:predicted metalloprotease with PDZ domain
LANDEAALDYRTGRDWRSLQDTATSAQLLYLTSQHWEAQRRSTDFYTEGPLLWLEVDAILREQSHGNKSIDDFAHSFYGPPSYAPESGDPKVVPYTFEDVVTSLNAIVPYDWGTFFHKHLNALRPELPAQGLEASGWRVVYQEYPNDACGDADTTTGLTDLRYSIGLIIDENDGVVDVLPDSPAGHANIAPAGKVVAVNHRVYSPKVLLDVITAAKGDPNPISIFVLRDGYYEDFQVNYHSGLRYPRLEFIPGKSDILSSIVKPRR